jgi:flagellar motor switch protein FliG
MNISWNDYVAMDDQEFKAKSDSEDFKSLSLGWQVLIIVFRYQNKSEFRDLSRIVATYLNTSDTNEKENLTKEFNSNFKEFKYIPGFHFEDKFTKIFDLIDREHIQP